MHRNHVLLAACAIGALASPPSLTAQAPPGTDIYLVSVRTTGGQVRFGDAKNVTDRPGYDNQPSFLPDGSALLYTSNRGDQTDIYRYDIAASTTRQVTATSPESEYSPAVTPAGNTFSVVRVEADSTQRLWQFTLDGLNPAIVLADVMPVGYFAWGDEHRVVLFVLGSPSTLQVADARTGEARIVAYNVGRSIHKIPGRHAVSFTHREAGFWIKELDLDTQAVTPLVELRDSEYYAWMPDGSILTGQESKLLRWHPAQNPAWQEAADFAAAGITGISRLAVSPRGDWLAIVGAREQ